MDTAETGMNEITDRKCSKCPQECGIKRSTIDRNVILEGVYTLVGSDVA